MFRFVSFRRLRIVSSLRFLTNSTKPEPKGHSAPSLFKALSDKIAIASQKIVGAAKEWISGSVAKLIISGSAAGLVGGGLLFCMQYYSSLKEAGRDLMSILPHAIEKKKISDELVKLIEGTFIRRPKLTEKILEFANIDRKNQPKKPVENYLVVYGPKGAGKTTAVTHALADRDGVVFIQLTGADSKDAILGQLVMEILGKNEVDTFKPLLLLQKALLQCPVTPVIIFDVERGNSAEQFAGLHAVRSVAKSLAGYCNPIIVLSEANAALEFGKDTDREKFLFVGEMSREEAKELLQAMSSTLSETEMNKVFDMIGTLPITLKKLTDEVGPNKMTLDDFIEGELKLARRDLKNFPLQDLLKLLEAYPKGLPDELLPDIKDKDGKVYRSIDEIGPILKRSNVIVYRIERLEYELQSTSHKTALMRRAKLNQGVRK